jgi:uncharacterized protein YndB with AHSA1/START domain/DNA-binding transcriptional ArsR family regulator
MNDDDLVFRALSNPSRRFLLDLLHMRDGRTLVELESELEMTRIGVMKHLRVLEDAGLIVTRRAGREKLHCLNPVPIRLIYDRWIDKYRERGTSALVDLKSQLEKKMTTIAETKTTQVYRVYIRSTPEAIWTAITDPEWNGRYGYCTPSQYDLKPGGTYRGLANDGMLGQGAPEVVVDGEVIEADPPRKLVQTWRMLMEPSLAAEGFTRLTYEIEPAAGDVTKLTVTHDLTGTPGLAALVGGEHEATGAGGGWAWVLSGLKTLLETGASLDG